MQVVIDSILNKRVYPLVSYESSDYCDCYTFMAAFLMRIHEDVEDFTWHRNDDVLHVLITIPEKHDVTLFNAALKFAAVEVANFIMDCEE